MNSIAEELLLRIAVVGGAVAADEVRGFSAAIAESEATTTRATRSVGGLTSAFTSMKVLLGAFAIGEAVKQFSTFQASMERLQTQTGATSGEVHMATKGILNMAYQVGTGPNSLALAMYHLESAGIRGKGALDALRISAEGAKIGGADLTDTTTAMTAVMIAGFRGVHTLKQAMGELNATVGAGDMTMQDLNDALGTGLLSTMKVIGLQVKDMGAALAVLGDNNIRGAQAATRLRMGLMMLVKPSGDAQKAMATLGLQPLQLAEEMRKPNGLLKMLELLHGRLQRFSKTRQAQLLGSIFGGGRNSAAMLTLIDQLGRLRSKYDEVGKGGRQFNKDWQATTRTLSFFIDQVKALAEVGLIKLGGALNAFTQGLRENKPWAVAVAGALLGLTAAIVYLNGAWVAATASAVASRFAFLSLSSVPIVALFAAIGVVILLLVTHFKLVKEVAVDAWHWIEGAAKDVWGWIKQHWPLLVAIILMPFVGPIGFIVMIFRKQLWGVAKDVWGWFKTAWGALKGVIEWPFKEAWKIIRGIWHDVVGVVEWAVKQIEKLLGKILGPIKSIGHFLGHNPVTHALGSVGSFVGHAFGFADGGTTPYSGAFMVGERGPELVYLPGGSYVQPNHELGLGGPSVLEATIYTVLDGKTVARSVVRQGLMAQARRGAGGPTLVDAG